MKKVNLANSNITICNLKQFLFPGEGVPLGEYPELTKKGIPVTGTENSGGPLVTAGGLIFIAGTEDGRFRAFDVKTGRVVWEYIAFALP